MCERIPKTKKIKVKKGVSLTTFYKIAALLHTNGGKYENRQIRGHQSSTTDSCNITDNQLHIQQNVRKEHGETSSYSGKHYYLGLDCSSN